MSDLKPVTYWQMQTAEPRQTKEEAVALWLRDKIGTQRYPEAFQIAKVILERRADIERAYLALDEIESKT